ncbi:MAG: hypothetical protein RJA76_170 [Bacteroidota bacterium]|jgi:uncharacterized protein YdeI (YjbR/CyaY-like superfamily)
MNPKVNPFFVHAKKWGTELEILRDLLLSFPLVEELKWNSPCYLFEGKNVIIIQGFKEYFSIMFFKGALLKDANNILVTPGEVQAGRQIRLKSVEEIEQFEEIIRQYIHEAIELEKSGQKVVLKSIEEYAVPEELIQVLEQKKELKDAFYKLTPGRQKGYFQFISDAKQTKTRLERIEKNISRILKGKGLNDCICGLSQRMPSCDGSHKQLKA